MKLYWYGTEFATPEWIEENREGDLVLDQFTMVFDTIFDYESFYADELFCRELIPLLELADQLLTE